jgi:hypothetical protein
MPLSSNEALSPHARVALYVGRSEKRKERMNEHCIYRARARERTENEHCYEVVLVALQESEDPPVN